MLWEWKPTFVIFPAGSPCLDVQRSAIRCGKEPTRREPDSGTAARAPKVMKVARAASRIGKRTRARIDRLRTKECLTVSHRRREVLSEALLGTEFVRSEVGQRPPRSALDVF